MNDNTNDGAATPSDEPANDFFSSWDKPTIKRPSNPPSRTGTPPVATWTASPFLSANTNGSTTRSKSPSPLAAAKDAENNLPAPQAARTTSSSTIRKTPSATGGPKRANILGAKKAQKLGAKKIVGEEIDFEAAERKAREEAERIEKLGYDPDAEGAPDAKSETVTVTEETTIAAPKPIAPVKLGYGAQPGHQRSPSEVERLGMGMSRLGFGQIGAAKTAATPGHKKMMALRSVDFAQPVEGKELPYHCFSKVATD